MKPAWVTLALSLAPVSCISMHESEGGSARTIARWAQLLCELKHWIFCPLSTRVPLDPTSLTFLIWGSEQNHSLNPINTIHHVLGKGELTAASPACTDLTDDTLAKRSQANIFTGVSASTGGFYGSIVTPPPADVQHCGLDGGLLPLAGYQVPRLGLFLTSKHNI